MMQKNEDIEVRWNLEIIGFDRGKRRCLHQRTHNIVVNNGRQFMAEVLSASAFTAGGFTRATPHVVRYMGVGIGGNRQNNPVAQQAPLSDPYPAGYGGSNAQTDNDLTVAGLERPIPVTRTAWLREVAAPPTFPVPMAVMWSAVFTRDELNLAPNYTVPISEVGLYTSAADPMKPNGGAGGYPGATTAMVAYDTFLAQPKTAFWSFLVNWTWQF